MGSIEIILSVIVGLVTIGTSLYALVKLWRDRVHVIRFLDKEDDYCEQALELYEDNFDDWERDEPDEIKRWLGEAQARRADGDRSLEEYLLATIWKENPCGFFYGTFYKSTSTLFVSYLVVKSRLNARIAAVVRKKLLEAVQKKLKADGHELKRILAEVEVPAKASTAKQGEKRKARIRRLLTLANDSKVPLRIVEAEYLQPKLDLRDKNKREDSLILLYARVGAEMPSALPRQEVADLFHFIYDELYGDCFMDEETQDQEWRQYTADLRDRTIAKLPERVRCASRYKDMA